MTAAEKIKVDHGCALAEMVKVDEAIEVPSVGGRDSRSMSKRVLAEICEPRCEEILALVDQELIKSGYKNQIAAGVVLTGGTSLIYGLQDLAEQVFDLPVRVGYPDYVGGLHDMVNSPKYATAVGLLLFGAENRQVKNPGGDFRIREDNVFNRILGRMKKWFVDIA